MNPNLSELTIPELSAIIDMRRRPLLVDCEHDTPAKATNYLTHASGEHEKEAGRLEW